MTAPLYTSLSPAELEARAWQAYRRLVEAGLTEVSSMLDSLIRTGAGDESHRDRIVVAMLLIDELLTSMRRTSAPVATDGDVHWLHHSWTPRAAAEHAHTLHAAAMAAEAQRREMLRPLAEAVEAAR